MSKNGSKSVGFITAATTSLATGPRSGKNLHMEVIGDPTFFKTD